MKMIVLLLLISQHASGVEVYKGAESVLLHCQVSVGVSSSDTAAVWNRVGLRNPTVHLRMQKSDDLDERDDLSGQNDLYQHRTSMRADALQTGVLSLTLKNPTVSDSGTYNCIYRKYGQDLRKTEVQLKVSEPPPPPVWPKVLAAVLVTLIILAAAIGLFVYCVYKRMKNTEATQTEVVEVPQGEESVLLPFKTTADLPRDVTVEWRLTEPEHMKVHVYESGNNHPDKQDQGYRGRTEMDKDPLRTKDLSLTLKDLHPTDSGVYTCNISRDGHMLLQKSVTLIVRESVPDIVQVPNRPGSVLLPFKTTADLPQDVTVEWRDSNNMKVHVYESGNNHPDKQDHGYRGRTEMNEDRVKNKDFSLTLKDPHLTDSGVYTCTVYNKDGHMLLQKSVALHVYDQPVRSLGTVCGNKSYLLEFEKNEMKDELDQISTVEWKRIYPKYNFIKVIRRHQGNEKDLSLNLEDPRLTDSGIYTCTAYKENGDILLGQSVIFSVRDFQLEKVEVDEGGESVLLPFKTTADLRYVLRVYWTVSESTQKMVDYFDVTKNYQPGLQAKDYIGRTEMNKDPLRTGDLSLTLKKPLLTDSRSYTCTVSNKDGRVLLQKVVILRVRATLKGTMEDMFSRLRRRRTAPNAEVKEDVRNRNQEQEPLTAEETV
uniref:Ig-like domain-containing protein n=1 Tax=Oreochromis aureus TaxID=47969 RepID=A0AAZ1X1Z4_OREAU